jgi:hypothetical protein
MGLIQAFDAIENVDIVQATSQLVASRVDGVERLQQARTVVG